MSAGQARGALESNRQAEREREREREDASHRLGNVETATHATAASAVAAVNDSVAGDSEMQRVIQMSLREHERHSAQEASAVGRMAGAQAIAHAAAGAAGAGGTRASAARSEQESERASERGRR